MFLSGLTAAAGVDVPGGSDELDDWSDAGRLLASVRIVTREDLIDVEIIAL